MARRYAERGVLGYLDNCVAYNPGCFFMDLEHPYFYTANSRHSLFAVDTNWDIVFEKSGYANRAFEIELEPNFFGSDLRNLKPGGRYNESAYDFRCELNNYSADRAPSDRRPSSYETFPLFAEVLVSGDPTRYRSTLTPTNHWSNRPEAGAL